MSIAEMETERSRLFMEYVAAIGTAQEKEKLAAVDLMDAIMDSVVEQEEVLDDDLNGGTNWDEWMIDNTVDRMREEMSYEV